MRLLGAICTLAVSMAADLQFTEHTLATDLEGGYQVVAADLNHDGRPDLIALASGMSELVWFENPGWQRHVLARGRSQMINLAAADLDGDGIPEIVLAERFAMDPRQSAGVVSLLRHGADPRQPWSVTEIDRLPASHRLRWAHPEGPDKPLLVNAPLAGAAAVPPDYRTPVALAFYRPGSWKRQSIAFPLEGVLHGILVTDWDGDGRDEILTASFLGIHAFHLASNGQWSRTEIAKGDPAPWPKSGASDLAVGHLRKRKFLSAIEPWHGNQVAVYLEEGGAWKRHVIDSSLADGHTLQTADFDGDGNDEIIAGYRGPGHSVYVYRSTDAAGKNWQRITLDSDMGAASCAVADLNGDGRPDLACIDSHCLKWYENRIRK